MADPKPGTHDIPTDSETNPAPDPFDSLFGELQMLGDRFTHIQTEMRNKFDAISDRLDEIAKLAKGDDGSRIEVRMAHIDRPIPNSEPPKPKSSGRPDELPPNVGLITPERDDPRMAKLHSTARELIDLLTSKSSLPQKLQANLVRASDPWQQYVLQKHSHHKLSSSTYNRISKYDVRWYRNAQGEYAWNWPLNSEPLATAFIEALATVCRPYRIDTAAILKRAKVKLSVHP